MEEIAPAPRVPRDRSALIARLAFDALVLINLIAQGLLAVVLVLGKKGTSAAPVAGGAVVALFLLMFLYARWLLPVLGRKQALLLILLKELSVVVLLALVGGGVWLLSLLF